MGSVLHRQLRHDAFVRVRKIYITTGLLFSGHQWHLGHRVATFQTVLLHALGVWLLVVAETTVRGKGSAGALAAFGSLQTISIGCLLLVLFLWLRDGVLLLLRRINLRGDRIEVVEDEGDGRGAADGGAAAADASGSGASWAETLSAVRANEGDQDKPLTPRDSWRCFRTHLGTFYYFDPPTELVHYLSNSGKANYAVDPVYSCTIVYDTFEELDEQLRHRGEPGYGQPQQEQTDASRSDAAASAPGGGSCTRRASCMPAIADQHV